MAHSLEISAVQREHSRLQKRNETNEKVIQRGRH